MNSQANPFQVNPFLGIFGQGYSNDKKKPMDPKLMIEMLKMQQQAPQSLFGQGVASRPDEFLNADNYPAMNPVTEQMNTTPFLGPVNWDQNAGSVDLTKSKMTEEQRAQLQGLLAGSSYEPPIPKRWVQAAGLARMNPIAAYAFQQQAKMKRRGK